MLTSGSTVPPGAARSGITWERGPGTQSRAGNNSHSSFHSDVKNEEGLGLVTIGPTLQDPRRAHVRIIGALPNAAPLRRRHYQISEIALIPLPAIKEIRHAAPLCFE